MSALNLAINQGALPANYQPTHLLTPNAVLWSILNLHMSRVHSSFLLYLHMRQHAIEQDKWDDIPVDLSQIRAWLLMPGGPVLKPMFRPFSTDNVKDLSTHWIKDHLPGSYALSSLRPNSAWLADTSRERYLLPGDHVQQAKSIFLKGGKVSALALGTFLFRNAAFTLTCEEGHPEDVVDAFREFFFFGEPHQADFEALFTQNPPQLSDPLAWFTPWSEVTAS